MGRLLPLGFVAWLAFGLLGPGVSADGGCGRTPPPSASPASSHPAPDLQDAAPELAFNPTCNVQEQSLPVLREAVLRWSTTLYSSLYFTRSGDAFSDLTGCGSERLPNGLHARPLLVDPVNACANDQGPLASAFAYVRNVLLGGFVQKPSATDLIFKNPSNFFYDSGRVVTLADTIRGLAFALLGGLLSISVARRVISLPFGLPYSLSQVLTRLAVGALFILFWGLFARVLMEFTTALTMRFAEGFGTVGGRALVRMVDPATISPVDIGAADGAAISLYAWASVLLALVFAARVFVLDAALVLGPLGLLLLVFPETRRYGLVWSSIFINTLFFQPLLAVLLWAGALLVVDQQAVLFPAPVLQHLFAAAILLGSLSGAAALESLAGHLHEYKVFGALLSPITDTLGGAGAAFGRGARLRFQGALTRLGA